MTISAFDIIRQPIVTEKTYYLAGKLQQYVFEVASFATREQVKTAVETAFDVEVVRVNIINAPAKSTTNSRSRRLSIRKRGFKKAIITLKPGDRIPFFEGVD
ncbi:MAG: 50S ribosomal protein L23 [Chloroflexi bacterium]|nr:50S ribosomal protein L23 [Chloroflexota bacterium]